MELRELTYVVVGLTFLVYVSIAIWARAGSTKEFYVAGGSVKPNRQWNGNGGRLDVSGFIYIDGRANRVCL